MPKRYEYAKLLEENEDLRRWYENTRRGSAVVADVNLRRIGYVCRNFQLKPADFQKMTAKEAVNLIFDVIGRLGEEGRKAGYMRSYEKAMKSWFDFNSIEIKQKIRIPKGDGRGQYDDEMIPTQGQLRSIFDGGNMKERTACSLISFSGVRPEVMGNFDADDGLKISDMPEVEILNGNSEVRFLQVPTMVVVRNILSKAGHQYFSFYPEEGCLYLKEYFEWRMRRGLEKLTQESPVITPEHEDIGSFMTTTNISDTMRQPIRNAGFKWRPYVLRRYFDTRLMMAEADALIIKDIRVFFMGHRGDIEAEYTVNKRLPQDVIDRLRKSYELAAERHLITMKTTSAGDSKVFAAMNLQFLKLSKFTDDEIKEIVKEHGDLSTIDPDSLADIIDERRKRKMGLNGNSQKIVPMADLESYITEGWEYVRDLPNGKAIVRLPK